MQHAILATLICGIMPGLMGLGFYGDDSSNKVYAAKLSIDNISTMQEMRPGICHNMQVGDEKTLTDTRDDNTYTIRKLSDGKCWMTDNLKLDLTQAGIATVNESDNLSMDFPEMALESLDVFTDDNAIAQFTKSPTVISSEYPGDGEGYKSEYGYYYSWCAATGGTCSDATTDGANAPGSICPKGWKLPQGGAGTTNDFAIMAGITDSISAGVSYWNGVKNISFVNGILTVDGSTWPAAGSIGTDGLRESGVDGSHWSSTASSPTSVYFLYFYNNNFRPANNYIRYFGRSIRCVSDSYAEEDVNVVAVKVAPTISIDASTGANVEVDPNEISRDGTITATISANTTYDVLLSADEPNLVSTTDATKYIPASSNIAIRTNGWGIKNNDNTYSAITTSPTTYYNTSSYDETKQQTLHTFSLGISIAPSLPSGTYSTTVTVTAVNN